MRYFALFALKKTTENELSNIVIGEAIKVHRNLGPGLLESVYETCLSFHLLNLGFKVVRQQAIPVVYGNVKLDCGFRCDLVVMDKLIIEIKAVDQIKPEGDRRFTSEWILYNILEMKFIEGRKVREVAGRLAMSEADL